MSQKPAGAAPRFEDTCMPNAVFRHLNLVQADFNDVDMSNSTIHNANLSGLQVSAVNLGGARFRHLGPRPDATGQQVRQAPVTFEEAQLCDSTFRRVDLSGVSIADCTLTGMTINGILVTELLAAYAHVQAK